MSPRLIIASALIPLGLIIAAVPQNTTRPYKLTANEMLNEVVQGSQFVSPEVVADMLVRKDPSLQLIDVRSQDEFEKFSLPGAINIPLADLLATQWQGLLNQDIRMNIFYSNGSVHAGQAWMITRQLGYKNNFVLQGGLNYWAETIMNPPAPAQTSPDEEIARYDFRKGAGQALGSGAALSRDSTSSPLDKLKPPPIQLIPKKKKVQGGC